MNDNKVTKDHIEAQISGEMYIFPKEIVDVPFSDSRLTLCILRLKNGFEVVGESSCVDINNFDKDIGRKIARENAFNKIWALEGYALRQKLFG